LFGGQLVSARQWTARNIIGHLKKKGIRYWMGASFVFLLTVTGSPYLYDYLHIKDARAHFFQRLLEWGPRPPEPNYIKIVLIEDDEYWGPSLGGRRPIKRDYLAILIDKLVSLQSHVIALDFDVRLPNPASLDIPQEYKEETDVLIHAILNAAEHGTKIVLATPISYDEQRRYRKDADIYQAHGLCQQTTNTFRLSETVTKNISCGYIALPYDPLVIPGPLLLSNGEYLDSFALAIAKMERPELVKRLLDRFGTTPRYANYISYEKLQSANAIVSARSVLRGAIDKEVFEGRAVIVGAHWSLLAADRGPKVDQHWTPVGQVVGAALQANFAEALLDSRVFKGTPDWILRTTEVLFSIVAAVVFAILISAWGKVFGIVSLFVVMLFVQWLMLHGFGVFFDALVPLIGLGLHSLYERLLRVSEAT
jgi:CHASE2 domain-containing sensor protein